jgi:uncharacterized cupredoxin-like copper-binding protein
MSRFRLAGIAFVAATAFSASFLLATARSSNAAATGAVAAPPVIIVTAGKPTEYRFKLSRKSVKHGTVIFKLINAGKEHHGFSINNNSTKVIRPHASAKLTVVFKKPGKYVYQCVQNYATDDDVANLVDTSSPQRCGGGILKVT